MTRKILVTSALPYANGHIHLGHLVEYIQTDIWVRFQKLIGNDCLFICADDTHGTAIMIRAKTEGKKEEDIIASMHSAHLADFTNFDIQFDHYGSTNCPENKALCGEIWTAIRKAGLVEEKEIEQLYDTEAKTFLADRFVKGICPKCRKSGQYGDNCESCGAHYEPTELIEPVSTLTGTVPVIQKAKHLFVNIDAEHAFLDQWVHSGALQSEIENYLAGQFLGEPLHPWDISRPAPYFGFEIPDSPGNYWYVWFDAPTGYMAATWEWCRKQADGTSPLNSDRQRFDDWWRNPQPEIHHFIGKDITYFHTLFWPAMLKVSGFTLPKKVHIHGFLTVNGEKMSKSRGTFILASTYLKHLDPAYLRYYYASKLSNKVDDIDLSFEEFESKVNADLVGNVVNLASRTAKFVAQGQGAAVCSGLAAHYPEDGGLFAQAAAAGKEIADAYETGDYSKAMRLIMECGRRASKFIEESAPWAVKDNPVKLQNICTIGLNLFRQMVIYLSPVLPKLKMQTEELLNCKLDHWNDAAEPLSGTPVNTYKHLMTRIDKTAAEKMMTDSKQNETGTGGMHLPSTGKDTDECLKAEPLVEQKISIDDFTKVDLRIARIIEASEVKEAKKLLRLKLSLGGDTVLNVFAGIKAAYEPEKLVGRLVVCVANLEPRQMKFGLSEGMVVAAGSGGPEVFLLAPDDGAKPGMRLH
ncbi:MAG: methionine--tRNA ligase [Planctomycetaceae bacterium]|jgi:methionyl-tRNA synthetase|nr:methionine--tRNA ligase [Planctomycetaceae bacterium]